MKSIRKIIAVVIVAVFIGAALAFTNTSSYFEITKNLDIFTTLYKELNTYYVDTINPEKLLQAGIHTMLEGLDPFTNYISETDIEGYRVEFLKLFGFGLAGVDYEAEVEPHVAML